MDTGIRRFILRLAVGLLAFFIGLGVSWAIGGLNPFQSSSDAPSYNQKRCGAHRSWSARTDESYDQMTTSEMSHEGRSCKTKRMLVDVPPPPPPPPPAAPVGRGGS